jgi:uncharacterized protein YndB with AHSA1/START domain
MGLSVAGGTLMDGQQTVERGFACAEVHLAFTINAPRGKVWEALTRDISLWWPTDFCADPTRTKRFRMELKLGGRLWEDWGEGNGWVWWTIYKLDTPNHMFAGIGYQATSAAMTAIEFRLEGEGEQTTLCVFERLCGALESEDIVAGQTAGWTTLFASFRRYVEELI